MGFVTGLGKTVKDWFVGKFTFAADTVIVGWDGLLSLITGLGKTIKTWFTDKFTFASDTVIAGWNGVLGLITDAVDGIKDFFWNDKGTGLLNFSTAPNVEGEEKYTTPGWEKNIND